MIDELDSLKLIREKFVNVSGRVTVGIGDDAAALKINSGNLLVATVDVQVEDVHFKKGTVPPDTLARRALAVALSDIGAMGGIPRFFLSSLGIPKVEDEDFLLETLDGFQRGAEEFDVELVGGNLSSSEKLFIDITALGEVEPELIARRKGAEVGDLVYVSGTLGDAALGLKMLLRDTDKRDNYLISRHTFPTPRLALGRALALEKLVSSMIDISDGLLLDLERITTEHGRGAEIYIDRVPFSPEYKDSVHNFLDDLYEFALSGGEDYELLFTSPEEKAKEIRSVSEKVGVKITQIGRVIEKPALRVIDTSGKELKYNQKGFIHFTF